MVADKSKFGYRLLVKLGWSEGKGLGRNLEGQTTAVKLARRAESLGLGAEDDKAGNIGWSTTSMSFNSVLATLNDKYGVLIDSVALNRWRCGYVGSVCSCGSSATRRSKRRGRVGQKQQQIDE